MSRSAVVTKAMTICDGVLGNTNHTYNGMPENIPDPELPIMVVKAHQPHNWLDLTMGPAGIKDMEYYVDIWAMLGPPDMAREDAEDAQIALASKMRAAFCANPTLTGACWDATLYDGDDNLQTYHDTSDYPQVTFRLVVDEYEARNSVAS